MASLAGFHDSSQETDSKDLGIKATVTAGSLSLEINNPREPRRSTGGSLFQGLARLRFVVAPETRGPQRPLISPKKQMDGTPALSLIALPKERRDMRSQPLIGASLHFK